VLFITAACIGAIAAIAAADAAASVLQLAASGAIPHMFSLCFGFPSGGALLLGKYCGCTTQQ
jgi:hypothetical protein